MTTYHWLGVCNFVLLGIVLSVSPYIMFGKHSKAKVFMVASVLLFLMFVLTVSSFLIYTEYTA